jgi:primosomal protein N'
MPQKLVNIAFNLPVDEVFTYSVPPMFFEDIQKGARVLAPLGSKEFAGIVIFPKPHISKSLRA